MKKIQIIDKTFFLLGLLIFLSMISNAVFSQFVSVQNGKWTSPQTWSTNPNATAIPDSSSTVIIHHTVEVSGYSIFSQCYDLIINTSGILTTYMNNESKTLYVKNSLTNNGLIRPLYGMYLTIRGHFINTGTISAIGATDDNFHLTVYGNIYNSGSFRGVKSTLFRGSGASNHEHHIRSWNDSTIMIGNASMSDNLGIIVVDSFAIIGAKLGGYQGLSLNESRIILPVPVYGKTVLRLDNAYLYGGVIEGNDQIVSTTSGLQGFLGNIYGNTVPNTVLQNVRLIGNFAIGGDYNETNDINKVIFEGDCSLQGQMRDWYTGSISFQGIRTAVIKDQFQNYGTITDATNDNQLGFKLLLDDESYFQNEGDMSQRCISIKGTAHFSSIDTLKLRELKAENTNCHLYFLSNIYLKGRFSSASDGLSFQNGHIYLLSENSLTVHNSTSSAMVSNAIIHANNGIVDLSSVKNDVVIENARIKRLGITVDNETGLQLTGYSTVMENGIIYNFYNFFSKLHVQGTLINNGTIKNNSSGSLTVNLHQNAQHQGIEWSNSQTTITGLLDQQITIPQAYSITGNTKFDAMIEGSSYKWFKDNQEITGANTRILNFNTGLNNSHTGVYYCLVDGTTSRNIIVNSETSSQITLIEEGFDEQFPPEGWQINSTNANYTWIQGNSTDHNFSTIDPNSLFSALCPWVAQNQDEWLISEEFSLGVGNAHVDFYAGYSTAWLNSATLKLYISTDNTKQWQQIWEAANDGEPWGWRAQSVDLTPFAPNETIQLAWQYFGNDGDLIGIDQVKVVGYPFPTSVNENPYPPNLKVYSNYPNPFAEQTTFVIETHQPQQVIVNVTDILGTHLYHTILRYELKGVHQFTFNPVSLGIKSGVLLCTFMTDEQKIVHKIVFQ